MKKNTKSKLPKKLKQTQLKSYKKIFTTFALISSSILLGLFIGIFYANQVDNVNDDIQTKSSISKSTQEESKDNISFKEKTKALEVGYTKNTNTIYQEKEINKETKVPFHFEEPNLEEIDKQEEKIVIIEPKLVEEKEVKKTIEEPKKKVIVETPAKLEENLLKKPKLAIIIDDVTNRHQVSRIQNIGYTVNMAFLPPTSGHKNSAKIVKKLDNYMIHLPLQASSSRYEEENTLYINDSIEKIDNRIQYLKKLYPGTKFLNNHTGSKFTSNQVAMDKLFEVLKKYDYTFIDSRTTAKSVAKESSEKYGVKVFSRNIFLDNKKDQRYIQKQLKKAIKIAKKRGMAIAIGHPYSITFKTLKESKHLLKDLDLVFVTEL